ncbi:MAG: hypothetical protein KAI73_05730, partial [Rhodospirillaceae bacterium]|nr:hypothetical protein [Rhodospirillaceae bacterium]
MSEEQPVSGPDRVGGMVSELFEFVLENGANINDELAGESVRMARERLGKICSTCSELSSDEPSPAIALEKTESVKPPTGNEQRKMHLLRLVSCKLSHAFDKQNNPTPIDRQAS